MKNFVDFSENLDDKKKQLMQKQRVMQQMEKERASRSNQEFQQDREEKQSKINQEKEEEKKLEQMKKEIKKEIKQEMGEVDEEFGKMTKKQTQAYTGMDDKEQKALYKKMKKDGNFDVKKNLAGAASDDKDISEELNKDDKPFIKKLVGKLRGGSKTHAKQADDLEKAMKEESNPRIPRKKGQPANSKKHSDLYTDENPKGTIHGLGFKDVATAKASVSKIRNSSRSHAHKIQAAVAMEQRARDMGKTSEAAVYRKFINSMKKKTKAMKESYGPRTKKPNFPKVQIKKKDPQQLIQIHFDTSKPGGGFDVGVDLPVIGNTKVKKTIKDLQRLPGNVQDLLNPETTDSDTNKVTDTVDDAINDYMKNKKGIKQRKRR